MSLGREFGQGEPNDGFNDSWSSPIIDWHFPQYSESDGGWGANFYDEILGEDPDSGTEDQTIEESGTTGEEEPEPKKQPTMPYEDAVSKAIELDEEISRHLGQEGND